jgi:DNA-binding NtrC family response regulator
MFEEPPTLDSIITERSLNPTAGARRIQLIGRDSQERDQVVSTLEVAGFRVDAVWGVHEALGRLLALKPNIVLLDLGAELALEAAPDCQNLITAAKNLPQPAPLVLLTDGERFGLAGELLRLGASDYLLKPFSPEDLLRRVSLALRAHHTPPRLRPGAATHSLGEALPALSRRDALAHLGAESLTANSRGEALPAETSDLELLGSRLASEDLLIGRSEAIQKVLEQVRLVAPKSTTVLIAGETGTGKERVARAIHALSRRLDRALVSVNCAGIPANLLEDEFFGHVKGAFTDAHQTRLGRFEQAHRGTIFLDEIGDLPLELQPKLLRVLQEREIHRIGGVDTIRVDARVIAATNVDLWSRVGEGRFREDLFYRINVFPIELPPLRERREDVPLFLDFFLDRFCRRDGLARKYVEPRAEAELMARAWPGNIRELENAVEIAVIRSRERQWLAIDDFPEPRPLSAGWGRGNVYTLDGRPPTAEHPADFKQLVSRFERALITRVLERAHGNKSQAAEMLRLKRTTLVEKLKKLDALDGALDEDSEAAEAQLLSRLTH